MIEALNGLLSLERRCDVDGDQVTARVSTPLEGPPPSTVLAALGPRMLELAGRATVGTVTWMTGPVALDRDIAPPLRRAADAEAARERLAPMMQR